MVLSLVTWLLFLTCIVISFSEDVSTLTKRVFMIPIVFFGLLADRALIFYLITIALELGFLYVARFSSKY